MTPGRENNGRFAKGNPGGPGRKPLAVEDRYLALFCEVVPSARARKIIEKAASQAEHGDAKAREWLFNYLAGKAPDSVNVNADGAFEIRYINNWRNDTPDSAPGAEDSPAESGPLSLVDGRPTLAQDDAGSCDSS
jgi:hypothetical protein